MLKIRTVFLSLAVLAMMNFASAEGLRPAGKAAGAALQHAPSERNQASLESTIDRYIRSFSPHEEFSGVILVAEGDRILFHRGYGLANREFWIPNGETTRFQIGSITKAFTSMLVLKLVEEGRLDLDKTISEYLPDYPIETGRRITLRHLLSNTSGIPHHYQHIPDYFLKDDHYFHTPRELIRLFWNAPLRHAPGEKFTYSSPGFYILGAILQQVVRRSYAELLGEYIFDPLGMKNTRVENNKTTDANLAVGYIRGLSGPVKAYIEDKSTALAAGDLLSTAYDLFLWQRTLSAKGDRILSESSKRLMFQPILPGSSMTFVGPHLRIPYEDGKKTLALSLIGGSSSGYAAMLSRQTDGDRCVIVLSNIGSDDVNRIADDIGDFFTRRYLGMSIGEEAPATRTLPPAAAVDPSEISEIAGFYGDGEGTYTGVVRDGGRLFYLVFGKNSGLQTAMEMTPRGPKSYLLSHNPQFQCDFAADREGVIKELAASRKGRIFNRSERLRPADIAASEYAGYYTSLELQKTFKLTVDRTILSAENFRGESSARLVPLEKDVFGFRGGFLRFVRGADHALAGFDVFTKDTDSMFGSKFIKIAD